jgi:flagellar biosynthesis/type III secretory pathway M-ring protein FliF/YscJ
MEPIMSTTTIWIIAAVVAVLALIVLVVVVSKAGSRRRHRQAEEIREQAKLETGRVERREALAQETAAKARAAQAEAEVKAAEAARLQEQAATHQSHAATSREQLQEQWDRAESIDPKTAKQKPEAVKDERGPAAAWGEESDQPTDTEAYREDTPVEATNHRGAQ